MPFYSRCVKKKLLYIAIAAPFSHQPSSYSECTKLNIRLFCDIKLVSNAKYAFFMRFYILRSLQLLYLIYYRVL